MTDPTATFTTYAAAIRDTKMPVPSVPKEPRNLLGLLFVGGLVTVGLGALFVAGNRNDRTRESLSGQER